MTAMAHLAYLRRGNVGHERLLRSSHFRGICKVSHLYNLYICDTITLD